MEDGSFSAYECLKHFTVANVKHRDADPVYAVAAPGDFIIVNAVIEMAVMKAEDLKAYLKREQK